MTEKKAEPAKRGPKPKPPGEKQEQLTVRLSPKLKYGLDFLARAQHRSLSQAVEWALQVGLHNYELGYTGGTTIPTIGSVVDDAWKHEHEADRLRVIYNQVPTLLAFEDFKVCELVERSREAAAASESYGGLTYPQGADSAAYDAYKRDGSERYAERQEIYNEFVRTFWPRLREIAVERANSGLSNQDVSVLHLLIPDEKSARIELNEFARMKAYSLIQSNPELSDEDRFKIIAPIHNRYKIK